MSRNMYTKVLLRGKGLDEVDKIIFKKEGCRIRLFSLQELIKIFPNYKIIMDKYISFDGTDVLIHIENYTHFLDKQNQVRGLELGINPIGVSVSGGDLIYITLDNGYLIDHKVHYIYEWMIQKLTYKGSNITSYKINEDIPFLPEVDYRTKELTKMRFKKNKEGLVWI